MKKNTDMGLWQKFFIGFTAIAFLMAGTVALASYVTQSEIEAAKQEESVVTPKRQVARALQPQPVAQHQQLAAAQPACDDSNIVGMLAGGAMGGILGNQVGKGSGNTAATIGGALGGAYVGGKYIPTRNVTCR